MNFPVDSHTVLQMSQVFLVCLLNFAIFSFFLFPFNMSIFTAIITFCIPKMKCYIIHIKKYNFGNNDFYLNRVNKTETLYGGVCASPDDDDDSDEEVLCTCSDKINRCSTNELIFSCIGLGSLAKGKSKIAFKYLFSNIHHQYDYFFFFI